MPCLPRIAHSPCQTENDLGKTTGYGRGRLRRESEKPGTGETNHATRSSVNRPEQALIRNLSPITYGQVTGLRDFAVKTRY